MCVTAHANMANLWQSPSRPTVLYLYPANRITSNSQGNFAAPMSKQKAAYASKIGILGFVRKFAYWRKFLTEYLTEFYLLL